MNNDILETYIERVTELREKQRDQVNFSDIQAIARELGMSDQDIEAAERASRDHLRRGRGFLEAGRIHDALVELEEASRLAPMDFAPLHYLSVAHRDRWLSTGNNKSFLQAEKLARRCIELFPDEDASYQVLRSLKRPSPWEFIRRHKNIIISCSVLIFICITTVYFFRFDPTQDTVGAEHWDVDAGQLTNLVSYFAAIGERAREQARQEAIEAIDSESNPLDDSDQEALITSPQNIPISLTPPENIEGITLDIRRSELLPSSEGGMMYQFEGTLINDSSYEINSLLLLATYHPDITHDPAIPIVANKQVHALHATMPVMRPGDSKSFAFFEMLSSAPANIILNIEGIQFRLPPETYPATKEITPLWRTDEHLGASIRLGIRTHKTQIQNLTNMIESRLELEITNQGDDLNHLKIMAEYYDERGTALRRREKVIASKEDTVFRNEDTRVVYLEQNLPANFDYFRIYIIEYDIIDD